jgi:soluble lytic murein transglycosylase-like protein
MKLKLIISLFAALICASLLITPAKASCENNGGCEWSHKKKHKIKSHRVSVAHKQSVVVANRHRVALAYKQKLAIAQKRRVAVKQPVVAVKRPVVVTYKLRHHGVSTNVRVATVRTHTKKRRGTIAADRAPVIAMIKSMAPSYGVPTWFALRIAQIESGYNPRARGLAGEYGVFQMKCATARGVGFVGNCSSLLNARINVRYGLKHLSLAVRSSHGNLRLAASKHNGGLGRKSLVPSYVAMVF